jgi:hypothetical protein
VTWTKLGDEFSDEARSLTDAEFRTHVEALIWSNRRGLDLLIPVGDLKRFAESQDADKAAAGLVDKGWWEDWSKTVYPVWWIGARFPEWQLERSVVEHRRNLAAMRQRRHRMHVAGDHRMCLSGRCPHVTRDVTRDPGRVGSVRDGGLDPKDQSIGDSLRGSEPLAAATSQTVLNGSGHATPPQTRKRVHDGPKNDGPDVQHDSIEVPRQSQATDRYAREDAP